jgi:hypothetical protein
MSYGNIGPFIGGKMFLFVELKIFSIMDAFLLWEAA